MPHTTSPKARASAVLMLLVFAVGVPAFCFAATRVPKHVCRFDEIDKYQRMAYTDASPITHSKTLLNTDSETNTLLPSDGKNSTAQQNLQLWKAFAADSAQAKQDEQSWEPLRIAFSSQDMRDKRKYCDKTGVKRKDAFGVEVDCAEEDVLTKRKKTHLYQIVRSAIAMHTSRLKVVPSNEILKVPQLEGEFCKLFTMSEEHKTAGVANTDVMLYVASFPSSKDEMFAAGAPCTLRPTDKRPVVGAFTFTTKYITPTAYSVRVAAHEIAHALGFTYTLMKNLFKMKIDENKQKVREKSKVTEVQTDTVIAKVKEHYSCTAATGMELEDEPGVLSVVSRSHWERRNALEELMAGIVTTGAYTSLTLAAFEDMGVYKADFAKAETMEYGANVGCRFLTVKCGGLWWGSEFWWMLCTNYLYYFSDFFFCAPGRRAMARCSPITFSSALPEQYKYIYDNINGKRRYGTGETRLLTDQCPIYEEYDDLSCSKESNAPGVKSAQSWCLRKNAGLETGIMYHRGVCGAISVKDDNTTMNVDIANGYASEECRTSNAARYITFKNIENSRFGCPTVKEVHNANDFFSSYIQQSKADENDNDLKTVPPSL